MKTQTPQSEAQIAAMFNRIAPRYDLLNRLLSMRQDVRWRRLLVQFVPYRPHGVFVDVATGTGDVLLEAAAKHDEYDTFVGIDIADSMLERARQKSTLHAFQAKTSFLVGSAERLDCASSSVDCLSIAFGLRNVVHKEIAIREFARVLNEDGYLLILEFFKPEGGLFAKLLQFYFAKILPLIGALISEKSAYRYLPESVAGFTTMRGLGLMLEKEGFLIDYSQKFIFGHCGFIVARKKTFD